MTMKEEPKGPNSTSGDYDAMLPYWDMVETILEGADAMRAAGQTYLPKFPNESQADYDYRAANAKFTNIYADIVSGLAAKPFGEEVALDEGSPDAFKALSEDIDGRGNNLHVFASEVFFDGINNAVDWVLVDYPKIAAGATLADQRRIGARPYWVHIPAKRMLAVYTDVVAGKELFVHARIKEDFTQRDGFSEGFVQRVRVFNREPVFDVDERITGYAPATFEVWEQKTDATGKAQWEKIEEGPITIGVIPLVAFVTGRRKQGSWRFVPPMKDAAFLQVEHFQQETALKSAKELVGYPMLAGNGVQPAMSGDKPAVVPVGPKSVLYAPPDPNGGQHGEWVFVKIDAEGLRFLADDIKATEQQLRELGRQPLTATAGITVISAAFASQKASSAIQAWALGLKDVLEQAFVLTAAWMSTALEPQVQVYTDFALEAGDDNGPTMLLEMRKNGDLSQETLWSEARRRNVLSADFDPEAERKLIEDEMPSPDSEAELLAAAGGPDPANDPARQAA